MLQLQPPVNIHVPRVELFRLVVDSAGNALGNPQVDAARNPVMANGQQVIVVPAGPDLIVDLMFLKNELRKHF